MDGSAPVELDDPARVRQLRELLGRKRFLRSLYEDFYRRFAAGLRLCPEKGLILELGSGAGFLKEFIAEVKTTDILPYDGIDLVVDAARMPFEDGSLRAICMLNVFHHLPDVEKFLLEAQRCLAPGGRVLMVDQYPGFISGPIYRHLHHERFDPDAETWSFASSGPLSGANGALAWIVFERDRARREALTPRLRLERYETSLPLSYWLAGGLKSWSLVPNWAAGSVKCLDALLLRLSPRFGSFVEIELVKLS